MLYTSKNISCLVLFFLTAFSSSSASPLTNLLLPSDAVYLQAFKTKADVDNKLHYNLNEHFDYCQWQGVKCAHGRVVRFGLQSLSLRGTFEPDTLSRLDQLRILILRNNSLSGPVPDLSGLKYLKTLFLDRNFFSGSFPPSILFLHQLLNLDLAHNNFTGLIPVELNRLDRVVSLRLESNRFNGPIPPLNQTTLTIFNVSGNNLTGPVPLTSTLKKFTLSSFKSNPNLCGDVVNKPCSSPFFGSPPESASGGGGASPPTPLLQNARSQGEENDLAQTPHKRRNKIGVVLGLLIAFLILIAAILSIFAIVKRRGLELESKKVSQSSVVSESLTDSPEHYSNPSTLAKAVEKISVQSIELPPQHPSQVPRYQQPEVVVKSGDLKFCSGEAEVYSLEQLMRGSAELLGRGTLGTTYKAVMDSQLIVCVKRLDATKAEGTSGEAFESHLEAVGVLRHPNLVPVRAYFQAKQERLIIYDYQPNGSLFNLIHGSRSTRAKPLHWTSCLKLAEDVAQGLVYIHQASGLVHGNLKSSNVLLGSDFEACLTDYCVSILANLSPNDDDPDSAGYKAPEVLKSSNRCTPKSDVYAFGVLLLELLSGKPPSHHPFLAPPDVADWVRVMRDDNSEEDKPLGLLVDVATICSLRSPEQRPTMRQVLKMIQDIKESAMVDSGSDDPYGGYS